MYMMESPLMDFSNYNSFDNFFNWTMTYRLDSDIVNLYAWIEFKDSDLNEKKSLTELSYPLENGIKNEFNLRAHAHLSKKCVLIND